MTAGEPIQLANATAVPAQMFVAIRAGFTAKAADDSPIDTPPWAR